MIASHSIPDVTQNELTILSDQISVNTCTVFDSQDITLASDPTHFLSSFLYFMWEGDSITFLAVECMLEGRSSFFIKLSSCCSDIINYIIDLSLPRR